MPLGELPIERTWGHTQQWPHHLDPAVRVPAGPPVVYPPPQLPDPADGELLRKALYLEREVAWWTKLAPHQAPPFRAMPLQKFGRAVLNAPSGSALGTAGAAAIAAAEGMIETVQVLPSTAVATNTAQTIASYTVPPGHRAVVRLWAAQIGDAAAEAVKFKLTAENATPAPDGLVNLAAFSDLQNPAETIMLVLEGSTIELKGVLIDTVAPAYVQVVFKGWVYPCLQGMADSERASLSDSFGPETNGRFTRAPRGRT